MKQSMLFAVVSILLIGVAAGLMVLLYEPAEARRAILISAALALLVQGVSYAIVRGMAGKHVIAGWGIGAILRFGVLIAYALVIVPRFGLPSAAATLSLALFLFVTTLVEPLFLKS